MKNTQISVRRLWITLHFFLRKIICINKNAKDETTHIKEKHKNAHKKAYKKKEIKQNHSTETKPTSTQEKKKEFQTPSKMQNVRVPVLSSLIIVSAFTITLKKPGNPISSLNKPAFSPCHMCENSTNYLPFPIFQQKYLKNSVHPLLKVTSRKSQLCHLIHEGYLHRSYCPTLLPINNSMSFLQVKCIMPSFS